MERGQSCGNESLNVGCALTPDPWCQNLIVGHLVVVGESSTCQYNLVEVFLTNPC